MERALSIAALAVVLAAIYILGLSAKLSAGGVVVLTIWTLIIVGVGVMVWRSKGKDYE